MLPQRNRSPGHLSPGVEAMGWPCFLAHPLQAPGSDWNPALPGLSAQQVRPLREGALPPFLRAPSPWGLGTFLPPRPPPPPNLVAPWSCRRPHGCHFCLPRVPGEAVLPEGGGWGWASQEALEGLPAPRRGFRFRGAGGGWSLGRGGERTPVLRAWLGPGWVGGWLPGALLAPPAPRARLFLPPAQLLPGAPPHAPLPLLGFLLGRAWCPPGPQDVQPGLWTPAWGLLGPRPAGPCRFRRVVEPPSSAFRGLGVRWPRGCEARLGLAFPVASPAFPGRGRKGVGGGSPASFWRARAGREAGGSWRAFWRREPMQLGAVGWGNAPGPQREPRASCLAMPELAYSSTGSSPPQEAACACTVGTVSDFAECDLAPLPRGPVGTAVLWALSLLGISSLPRGICFWPPDVCVYSVSFTA